MDQFLCNLINKPKFLEFGVPELVSLARLFGVSSTDLFSPYGLCMSDLEYTHHFTAIVKETPFLTVWLPNPDIAQKIARRSVCINRFTRMLSRGQSVEELVANTRDSPVFAENTPFAFRFDTYHNTLPQEEKARIVAAFEPVPIQGVVDLKAPVRQFIVSVSRGSYYFGLEVGRAKEKRARFYNKYALSDREYLGPTTTDMELAFLMANQGAVTDGSLVFDPFVGTASILIAAAHFGAVCVGGDIDIRVLNGWGVGRSTKGTKANVFTNFVNYQLPLPDMLRVNNAKPCLAYTGAFDAIICDPPYGVRASVSKKAKGYDGIQVVADLLDLASGLLRVGGKLVYLLPCDRRKYTPEDVPNHPMLEQVSNSENVLSTKISRRLITMQKRATPQENYSQSQGTFYGEIRAHWFK